MVHQDQPQRNIRHIARGAYLTFKALGDLGVGFADIYIQADNNLTEEQLNKWNTVVLLYSAASFSTSAVDGVIQKFGKKAIRSQDDFRNFEKALNDSGIDIDDALQKSTHRDDIEEVVRKVNNVIETPVLYRDIDKFTDAIAKGDNVFYVGKHTDITPRPTGVQSHHGVNSVWMESNYSNYNPNLAPSVYMLNDPNHNATRAVFNKWRSEMATIQGTSAVDYSKINKDETLKLSELQFDAANVPEIVRKEYYELWEEFIKTLKKK